MRLKKYDAVTFDNLFAGDNSSSNASAYVVAPITALINNDYENVDIDGLDLTIKSTEEPRTATVERVWIDDPRPRAGRTVPLKVLLRTYRGEDMLRTIPIAIPSNASGNLVVMVSDGQRLSQTEQREARLPQPRSVPQLIRALNKARRNNTLYVKLLGSDAGAVVNGEVLSSLPPSVLAVLEADRSGGNFNPLSSATLGEWELPTDHVISGVRTLTIQVSRELTARVVRFHIQSHSTMVTVTLGAATRWSSRRFSSAPRRRRAPRRPSSSRPPPRPTSSRATSRTSRSTAADSWSSDRPPSWSTKRRRRFSGR